MSTTSTGNYKNACKMIQDLKDIGIEANITVGGVGLPVMDYDGRKSAQEVAARYGEVYSEDKWTWKQTTIDALRMENGKEPLTDLK